jgi:hypothetical protein
MKFLPFGHVFDNQPNYNWKVFAFIVGWKQNRILILISHDLIRENAKFYFIYIKIVETSNLIDLISGQQAMQKKRNGRNR